MAFLVGRFSYVHGAGDVRAVAVLDAAEVHHDHVPVLDHPLADLVMRVGAVGARADDREVDLRVAVLSEQPSQVGADLGFAPAGEAEPGDLLERGIDGLAGIRQALELIRVLDRAQHRQLRGHRHVARVRQRLLEREHVHRPSGIGDRVASAGVKQVGGHRVGIAAVGPVAQRDNRGPRRPLGIGPFENRDDHRRIGSRRDHEHRDPLADHGRLVAREVDEVRAGRHQQAGEAGLLCLARRALDTTLEILRGERRWRAHRHQPKPKAAAARRRDLRLPGGGSRQR